ncbi:hypothetical protein FA10DRAFT_295466 [Acaromyces ingoldii]|uniref:Uncharacterized protein n=1 Tax=Acaromyces ingoldii TaxID=215250 RepID=A0A316YKB8_9BASI|nr:hypothetical protein FA10DRAFT_295466 [Acaromyces ingoldii]PWN89651.1 hypothetical protein FA10DRAFT_295466 [Acaromyces ingoldii]
MKFALLATTLLALLLTSTCIASALQSNHEGDGGYSNVLVKRFSSESSSENSPPTPPHLRLRRGNPDALVQRFREEQEREKRKQAAAGPSSSKCPSMSDAVDETALGVRKKQRRQQRCTEIGANEVELKKATFLDILRAREPFYQKPKNELTAEEETELASAYTSQALINLAPKIFNKISLTPFQKDMLKSDGRFKEYQELRKARFRQTKIQTAMDREKRRRRFEKRGLFNAPLSYRALEPEDLKELWQRLKKLVKNIEAIKKGDNGKKWQLVKLWTQEDSEWWKGYIEFRQKAEAAVPRIERLVDAINTFFADGEGKNKMPATLENAMISGGFRPPEAYQEALLARQEAFDFVMDASHSSHNGEEEEKKEKKKGRKLAYDHMAQDESVPFRVGKHVSAGR